MAASFEIQKETRQEQYPYELSLERTDTVVRKSNSSIELFEDGCWVGDVRNCTIMCTNSSLIWSGDDDEFNKNVSANVGNCIAYPIIANFLDQANGALKNPEVAGEFGILKASQIDLSNITESVGLCLRLSCDDDPNACSGNNDFGWDPFQQLDYSFGNITLPSYTALCLKHEGDVNPDIAGIGVLIAYLMAAALLLIMYIGFRISRHMKYLSIPYFYLSQLWQRNTHISARKRGSDLQQRIASSRHIAILITSLADFQKGQCVFWLAINAAVLLGAYGNPEIIGSKDLASFGLNRLTLQVICVCGYLFTTFGLYCLHLVQQRSWYIYSFSFVTALCSAIGWGATFFIKATEINPQPESSVERQKACGPVNPRTYCYSWGQGNINPISDYQIDSVSIGVGGLCMLVLLLDMILHNTRYRDSHMAKRLCTCQRATSRWRSFFISLIRFLTEVIFIILWAVFFTYLFMTAKYTHNADWGFGQIIALTIWIPVLLEWIYATFRGLEKVSEHRVAPPYKLIKIDETTVSEETAEYIQLQIPANKEYGVVETDVETNYFHGIHPAHRTPQQSIYRADSRKDISFPLEVDGKSPLLH